MKYIVYLTTNLKSTINNINRIYVGVHQTENPEIFDGYIGCGVYIQQPSTYKYPKTAFQAAVKKYGTDAFKREILFIYDTLEEAYAKEAEIVDEVFVNQSHVYNMTIGGNHCDNRKTLYQYDINGNLQKVWKYSSQAYEFYGESAKKFYFAIHGKYAFLDSFWSFTETIDCSQYSTKKHGNPKIVYLYDKNGKLLQEFESSKKCAEFVGIKDLTKALANESLVQKQYYVSRTLVDEFKPKARLNLMNETFYVYQNNELLGIYTGKEIMPIINLYSWSSIRDIFRYGQNWYKDFYISLQPMTEIPSKVYKNKIKVDIYDKYGNFIETLNTIKEVKEKYNVPASKIINLQMGDKYFNDYIFKYNSK